VTASLFPHRSVTCDMYSWCHEQCEDNPAPRCVADMGLRELQS
jgi:hypothetical protein